MRTSFSIYLPDTEYYVANGGVSTASLKSHIHKCVESVVGVRRKKPVGWMEPTDYYFYRRRSDVAYGSVHVFVNSGNWSIHSGWLGNGSRIISQNHWDATLMGSTLPQVSTENSALIKARNDLQSTRVNYGQAIGESNQTARLVGDSCLRLARTVKALARGDARGVAKQLSVHKNPPRKFVKKIQKTISAGQINRIRKKMSKDEAERFDKNIRNMKNVTGAWLELQYGWKPLLADVRGSIQNLKKFDRYAWIMTGKGSARENVNIRKVLTTTGSFHSGVCEAKGFRNVKYILIGVPTINPAAITNDLGLANLPLVGWELVPFSFVVDWFLPVGAWIDSLDATLNYTELRTVKSVFCKIDWHDYGDMSVPHSPYVKSSAYNGFSSEVNLKRTVSAGVPIPGRPSIKDPFSYAHMANGLALLVQIFGPGKSTVVR